MEEKQSATENEFNNYIFEKIKELGYDDGFYYLTSWREKEKMKKEGFYPTYFKIEGEVYCNF